VEKGESFQMNLLRKVERSLIVLAIAPLHQLEKKERDRRLEERLKRIEQRQKHSSFDNL